MLGSRIRESRNNGATTVVIGPSRNMVSFAFSLLILGIAVAGFSRAVQELVQGHIPSGGPSLFILFWLAGAAVFAALALANLLAVLWARWELTINDRNLTVAWRLPPLKYSKTYLLSDISKVRIEEKRARGLHFQTLAFEHGGKTHHATPSLPTEDLKALLRGPLKQVAAS